MKRALVFLLASVLALGLLPLPALGASMKYGDYQYILDKAGNASIKKYMGSAAELVVPSELDGHPVTKLSQEAFKDCKSLVAVTLPGSVTSIGARVFQGCESLSSLTLPEGLTIIGYQAFDLCTSLASLTLPDSLTGIGGKAFGGCTSLTILNLPGSVTSIGEKAFEGCTSLSSLTLPNSLTRIDTGMFDRCTSLASLTLPNGLKSLGNQAFCGCISLTSLTLPASLTSIGASAFERCESLSSLTFPDSLTSIGEKAFDGCTSLSSLTLPAGVTHIAEGTFHGCTSLASLTLPDNLTGIGASVFLQCPSLSSLALPASLKSIGIQAFDKGGSLVLHVTQDSYAHRYAVKEGLQVSFTPASAEAAFAEYAQGKLNAESLFTLLNLCGDIAEVGFDKGLALLGQGEKAAEFSRFAALLSDCDSMEAKAYGLTDYLTAHCIGTQEDRLSETAHRFFSAGVGPGLMDRVRGLGLAGPIHYAPALWTQDALEKFFGSKDVSPSHPQPDTCLVILDAESRIAEDYRFRPVSGDGGEYDTKAKDILDTLSSSSSGKLKFTGNPYLASVWISIRITYAEEGIYFFSDGSAGSIPGYGCTLALQASDAVSGKTIAMASFHESPPYFETFSYKPSKVSAPLPAVYSSSAEMKTFVEKILAH